jgi:uncharacterized RDD family membrane protein YckC
MESAAVTRETVSVGFGERFVALLIDVIIVGIAGAVARAIFSTGLGVAVSLVIGVAYYTYFWSSTGQTLGKMAMNLKVVKADGSGLVDIGGGVIRYVGYIISGIPLFLGYFWVLWDGKHDAWHDKIAGTKVIKVAR